MSDFYTEQLVKRKTGGKEIGIKVLLIVAIIGAVFLSFIFTLGIVIALALIIAAVILFQRLDVEYEYSYYNGEMDIDIIYHKAKRKRVFSMHVNDMELLAPAGAAELREYQSMKGIDYSSGNKDAKLYTMILSKSGQKTKIVFEPQQEIVEGFFLRAPRKVIRK